VFFDEFGRGSTDKSDKMSFEKIPAKRERSAPHSLFDRDNAYSLFHEVNPVSFAPFGELLEHLTIREGVLELRSILFSVDDV